jgi:hypothetical protein
MFGYFKRALVTRRTDGQFLGSGVGSCNSREKKYAARWVFERDVPAHLDLEKLPKKEGVSKKNNRPYVQYRVPNPEIFDLVNTIEKMACKRALVAAMISVTRSAGIFTQDLEDLQPMDGGAKSADRSEVHEAKFDEPPPPPARQAPPSDKPAVDALLLQVKAGDDAAVRAAWEAAEQGPITPAGCTVVRAACVLRWTALAATEVDLDKLDAATEGFAEKTRARLRKAIAGRREELDSPDQGPDNMRDLGQHD